MRLIVIAVLVLLALLVWRVMTRPGRKPGTPPVVDARMVRCERCGVYLPEDEACRDGERFFCSDEHRRQGG